MMWHSDDARIGRTVKKNGNRGTDHGHANAMFIVGNTVRGGKLRRLAGTEISPAYEGRDPADHDFRTCWRDCPGSHLGGEFESCSRVRDESVEVAASFKDIQKASGFLALEVCLSHTIAAFKVLPPQLLSDDHRLLESLP
jgi:hypothetical protein